ncbi:uncharacterized protein PAC_09536 [Phialocephala subalpina]|uniref:Uncharacterized protein n=1 Tax=Phialocephala subalpina TaxID=576137 RepID=A0A1L7X3P2_9HELO|nr:uncharacterized protein PAC_09536 [Phialocephala subalpina]
MQPQIKRQAQEPEALKPQIVYVVIIDNRPMYNDPSNDVAGVYSTLTAANNALKSYVSSEYSGATEYDRGVREDGSVYWSCDDVGEGDGVEIRIEEMELQGDGAEEEIDWDDEDGEAEEEEGEDDDGDED